jgi:lactate dehydrogenase-like 2-hydroxyacid dehydrogenase
MTVGIRLERRLGFFGKKYINYAVTINMHSKAKVVLITGSTDGVGRLVARRLADQGARILIHGRDHNRGQLLLSGAL